MPEQELRQGDYLPQVQRLYVTGGTEPVERPTPAGVVVLSQCCDLARHGTAGDLVCAEVVELNAEVAANANRGRSPRYTSLPHIPSKFADFGSIGGILFDSVKTEGRVEINSNRDRQVFAARIARRFSRYAYPDQANAFLRRLQQKIRSKSGAQESPLGRCLDRIQTIRIEADWETGPPWSLTMLFVLKEGELPSFSSEPQRGSIPQVTVADLAAEISRTQPGTANLDSLWQSLCDALVRDAKPDENVREVAVEVMQESELGYDRYRRSTDIDIDDLSDAE